MIERTGDLADVGTRTAVGAGVAGSPYLGIDLPTWVTILTIIFLVVSILEKFGALDPIKRWFKGGPYK